MAKNLLKKKQCELEQTLEVHFHLEAPKQLYHHYLKLSTPIIQVKQNTSEKMFEFLSKSATAPTLKIYPSAPLESIESDDLELRLRKNWMMRTVLLYPLITLKE